MRTVAIIQARMTSCDCRAALADLNGVPLLVYMIGRVRQATSVDDVWVATTENSTDDGVVAACSEIGINVYLMFWSDFFMRLKAQKPKSSFALIADCPMIDPGLIDQFVTEYQQGDCDYLSNVSKRTYSDGLDVEVFDIGTLTGAPTGVDESRS